MTLEEKAEEYAENKKGLYYFAQTDTYYDDKEKLTQAYLAGAKENGVVWHDLRKDPNDLPKDNHKVYLYAKDKEYYIGFLENGAWKYEGGFYASGNFVIAWTYIPEFKE